MNTYPMSTITCISDNATTEELERLWRNFLPRLQTLCRRFVRSLHVPVWNGQEEDIVQDILLETARRIVERTRKVTRGELPPSYSFEHMVTTIAHNYCRDMRRHDQRLYHLYNRETASNLLTSFHNTDDSDYADIATELVFREMLFAQLACDIAAFPGKQRQALLTDLANRMSFGNEPTALQRAFLNTGIRLQDYQRPLPADVQERRRYAALLHCAYQRIARVAACKQSAYAA